MTRFGVRTRQGAVDDGMNSAKRYYIQNVEDVRRQELIDTIIGLDQTRGGHIVRKLEGNESRKKDSLGDGDGLEIYDDDGDNDDDDDDADGSGDDNIDEDDGSEENYIEEEGEVFTDEEVADDGQYSPSESEGEQGGEAEWLTKAEMNRLEEVFSRPFLEDDSNTIDESSLLSYDDYIAGKENPNTLSVSDELVSNSFDSTGEVETEDAAVITDEEDLAVESFFTSMDLEMEDPGSESFREANEEEGSFLYNTGEISLDSEGMVYDPAGENEKNDEISDTETEESLAVGSFFSSADLELKESPVIPDGASYDDDLEYAAIITPSESEGFLDIDADESTINSQSAVLEEEYNHLFSDLTEEFKQLRVSASVEGPHEEESRSPISSPKSARGAMTKKPKKVGKKRSKLTSSKNIKGIEGMARLLSPKKGVKGKKRKRRAVDPSASDYNSQPYHDEISQSAVHEDSNLIEKTASVPALWSRVVRSWLLNALLISLGLYFTQLYYAYCGIY